MTREQAVKAVAAVMNSRWAHVPEAELATVAESEIILLETLGLIKFDEPIKAALSQICVRRGAMDALPYNDDAERMIPLGDKRADRIIEGLASAGFKITPA